MNRTGKIILTGVAVLFLGSIAWSIVVETLLPLARSGDWRALVFNLIGIPLILLATAMIVYGGLLVVRHMFMFMSDAQTQADIARLRTREDAQGARCRNLRRWFRALGPGLIWMALGFGVMAAGGYLINR
ncbi:MAG: hypothetical protein ACE5FI_17900 [Anaerolineales bacterium]